MINEITIDNTLEKSNVIYINSRNIKEIKYMMFIISCGCVITAISSTMIAVIAGIATTSIVNLDISSLIKNINKLFGM